MKITFCSIEPALSEEFQTYFGDNSNVEVHTGDIFDKKGDAVLSPANSFSHMDGGIDLRLSQVLGWSTEAKCQRVINDQYDGELLVGQAIIVPTGHADVPWLISAPTMRVPMNLVSSVNVYLAFRAALRAVIRHNSQIDIEHQVVDEEHISLRKDQKITSLLCPGMGTGVGKMEPRVAVVQMLYAYNEVIKGYKFEQPGIQAAHHNHYLIAKGVI